jgi:hypothetical protein
VVAVEIQVASTSWADQPMPRSESFLTKSGTLESGPVACSELFGRVYVSKPPVSSCLDLLGASSMFGCRLSNPNGGGGENLVQCAYLKESYWQPPKLENVGTTFEMGTSFISLISSKPSDIQGICTGFIAFRPSGLRQ